MTAVIRNSSGEERYVPLAGGIVADGETFEVDDETYDKHVFSRPDFHVVSEPKRKPRPAVAVDIEKES